MKKYATIRNYARLHHKQAGMTLIELTVVLMILVGLAGLLIPYVSGFMEKTHDSTTVASIADLNSTIQRYQVSKLSLPKDLETLHNGTSVYTYIQNPSFLAEVGAADQPFANASLSKAGVTTVLTNAVSTTDATFASTSGGTQPTLGTNPFAGSGTGTKLVQLASNIGVQADQTFFGQLAGTLVDADGVKNQLMYAFGGTKQNWDTACTNYIVMGIGASTSLIPSVMQGAPVHFGGSAGEAPATVYDRFVAVFAVPNASAGSASPNATNISACMKPDAPAKFIGTAGIMDFPALVGLNGAQQWANANMTKD